MKKLLTFIAILFFCNLKIIGQSPYILNDINASLMGSNVSFQKIANLNGSLIFMATNAATGSELWKSDGTQAGTVLIKDLNPGAGDSYPDNFFAINNIMYFTATDGVAGLELWKTDGTAAGTIMLKDIYTGSMHSRPSNFVNVNGTLFFSANDAQNYGTELYKSNGTAAGTVLVKDIWEGQSSSTPFWLTNVNGTLFFSAQRGDIELWKSDGTAAGTVRVKNINLTSCCDLSSIPAELTNVNGALYFIADNGTHGRELWRSNGTEAGTQMMKDIYPGAIGSNATELTWVPETASLYYAADDGVNGVELHSFNQLGYGIEADINPTGSSFPKNLINIDGILHFSADDGTHGIELWKSDFNLIFVEPTTSLLADINFGMANSNPTGFTKLNGQIYFSANDGVHGFEIWQTDGTIDGTLLFKDVYPGAGSSGAGKFTDVTNGTTHKLFFVAKPPDVATYPFYFWSLGYCGTLSSLALSSKTALNQVSQSSPTSLTCFCDHTNNLIASVNALGASPVFGTIKSKVWIDATQPATYVKRHYEITPETNPNNATGRVMLYFTQAEFNAYNTVNTLKLPVNSNDALGKANVRIEKRAGTSTDGTGQPNTYPGIPTIIDPADTDVVYNFGTARWEITFDVTGFSGFFLTTIIPQIPLPITLINFAGKKIGETNLLNWQTSIEINASHFEVERSSPLAPGGGISSEKFEKIGQINTNESKKYEFQDRNPLRGHGGFYRLKLVDLNGKYDYSKIIYIENKADNEVVGAFYPNPTPESISKINITAEHKGEWLITKRDIFGKILKTEIRVLEKGLNTITVFGLDKGLNIIQFENEKNSVVRKLIR